MTSFLKFLILGLAVFCMASPGAYAGEKKNKDAKKDYSEPEFDSLEDTSSSGWKPGTGSNEGGDDGEVVKKKEPCPKGQIRDSNGKCREVK